MNLHRCSGDFAQFFSNGRGSGPIEERRGCLAHVCPNKARPARGHFWRCCYWTQQDEVPSQDEGCRAGTLPQLVEHLVPAQLTGEHFFIPTFLSTYRKFTSTEQVLDLLFQTFSRGEAFKDSSTQHEILPFSSQDGMPQDKLRNAISSILDMWLDEYGEDFCQPAHFACLKQLLAHLKRHMTGTHVESRDNCSWVRWRPKSQARHSLMVWKLGGKTEERGGMNTQSAAISTSGSSQLKWMDQDKGGPEMSSTNSAAMQSDSNVQSAPSSSSYPELIRSISQTSSGDPKKVQGSSSRSTGVTSLASASQSSPTDTSTMDTNSANTHSGTSGQKALDTDFTEGSLGPSPQGLFPDPTHVTNQEKTKTSS
ncbi:uncharacterized protein RHO17_004772 [Thomomys bottae]